MDKSIHVSGLLVNTLLRFVENERIESKDYLLRLKSAASARYINIELWWDLLNELTKYRSVPALGLHIGFQTRLEDAGIVGHLAASCDTLLDALVKVQKFESLLYNLSHTKMQIQNDGVYFTWEGYGNCSTPLSNDVLIAGLIKIANLLVGEKNLVKPIFVELAGISKDEKKEHEDLLNCEVRLTENILGIKLPQTALSLPIDTSNPHLKDILEQQAEAILSTLPQADGFIESVQKCILTGLETGQLSAAWLSDQLSIAERTLFRMFAERGRSYQGLLDGLRLQLAKRYLLESDLTLVEIGLLLGYSDQTAFSRAFKKWVGTSPLKYRKTEIKPK
jgi:AraC-like DNA-binding protein